MVLFTMLSHPSVIPIHTAVKGRARLKIEALVRSEALKFGLENHFIRRPDIRSASASTTTGNLLVHYSADLSRQQVRSLVAEFVAQWHKDKPVGADLTLPDRPVDDSSPAMQSVIGPPGAAVPVPDAPWYHKDRIDVLKLLNCDRQKGLAVVVTTSIHTEYGKMLALTTETFPPQTPLIEQLGRLSRKLLAAGGLIAAFVMALRTLRGFGLLESLKIALPLGINVFAEILPALALLMESTPRSLTDLPGSDPEAPIFNAQDAGQIAAESLVLAGAAMVAYGCGILRYGPGARPAALAHESLTAARLLHVYNCRRGRRPNTNPYLTLATTASFVLQLAPFFVPGLRRFLKIAPLTPVDLAIAGANAGLALIVNNRLRHRQSKPREE